MNSIRTYEQNYQQPSARSGNSGGKQQESRSIAPGFPEALEPAIPFLNKLPVGILAFNTSARLLWANAALLNLLGYENPAVEGLTLRQFFSGEDHKKIAGWLGAGAASSEEGLEALIRPRPGKERKVRLGRLPLPFTVSQEEDIVLLSVEVLSPQKEEDTLAEAQREQEKQQKFLASMSHEIRNSANVITGIIHSTPDGRFAPEKLQHLHYTGRHLLHLTENLLYYSKIREDKFRLAPARFNLQELLSSLAQAPAALLKDGPAGFEFYQDPRLPVYCIGDKAAIYQITLNLLSNAIKFTREGSVALWVKMLGKDDDGRIRVSFQVKDTGPGIPPEQLDAIFGRFSQCEANGRERPEGYGLGLAISRELAGLMDGRITVQSQVGQGSTFEVQIPLQQAPAPQPGGPKPRPMAVRCSSPLRVLVLEDEPLSRSYLENFLQSEGLAYHACANGQEALQALEREPFDLALLDLHTPLLSGFEVAINLRNSPDNPNCNIPAIALSGGQFELDSPHAREAGFSHFLAKPYCPDQLKHLLRLGAAEWQKHTGRKFQFSPGFDREELQTLYGGRYNQILSMFEVFLRNTPNILDEMSETLGRKDWPNLARHAHKAKPSFALVGWRPVTALASQLEQECLNGKGEGRIRRRFLQFETAAREALGAVSRESRRLNAFQPNHTPSNYAYPDRR